MDNSQSIMTEPQRTEPFMFLALPGEIRNNTYLELLPNLRWNGVRYVSKDGRKISLAFMTACKQIHQEACSLLYANKTFEVQLMPDASVHFLNMRGKFDKPETSTLGCLKNIEVLNVQAHCDAGRYICDLQDAMFKFFGHLGDDHKLHTLNVRINTSFDDMSSMDYYQGSETTTGAHGERAAAREEACKQRQKPPMTVLRGHIAAFLTDPLRMVRLNQQKRKATFTLHFMRRAGAAWRKIRDDVKSLVLSNTLPGDYKVFCRYFEILRKLLDVMAGLKSEYPYLSYDGADLVGSRIRGDIEAFRHHHFALVAFLNELPVETPPVQEIPAHERSGCKWTRPIFPEKERPMKMIEARALADKLIEHLPAESLDTSFFGYNESEEMLREWKKAGNAC